MNEQLLNTLKELDETLKQQAQAAAAERDNASKEFLSTLKGLTDTLNEVADNSKIQQENSAAQISAAVKAFNEIVNHHNDATKKTFNQIQTLLSQTEIYLLEINKASTSLKQAAELVKQSTLQLRNNLVDISAQMKTLSTANQTTRENLSDLSARLRDFVNNFNGIASEFERSTKIIKDSLENYNSKMSEGLTKNLNDFDKTMTKAVGHLQGFVEDLTDAVEDLRKIRR